MDWHVFQIFVPTSSADNWRQGLTDPYTQWRDGYSAKSLAYRWEEFKYSKDGFPPKIAAVFKTSSDSALQHIEPLMAFPEYHVLLPGGNRGSQNDLFVLAKDGDSQLVSITVEGKVNESFGPTIEEWQLTPSPGKTERLAYLQDLLGLIDLPTSLRYQLLHRTASALIEAKRFNARHAIMLVHSFSLQHAHFEDYRAFVKLYGVDATPGRLLFLRDIHGIRLYTGWVQDEIPSVSVETAVKHI